MNIQSLLEDIAAEIKAPFQPRPGAVADYIPGLEIGDPNHFAISVTMSSSENHSAGDPSTLFSIQSISIVFTFALLMAKGGEDL